MDRFKSDIKMWLNGLILVTILAIAECSEPELNVEAAFQGRCGRNSPCEQLCYEIHYGMYECGCTEGYELDKNGYSCQEMNTTFLSGGDPGSRAEEDVLYQKGVSFSAKLEGPTNHNQLDNSDDDDDEDETNSEPAVEDNKAEESLSSESSDEMVLFNQIQDIRSVSKGSRLSSRNSTDVPPVQSRLASTVVYSSEDDDNFYAKQDMSVYDDVNNNRLNIRPYHPDTYQNQQDIEVTTLSGPSIATRNSTSISTSPSSSTTSPLSSSAPGNLTEPIRTTALEPCLLDCGLDGVCEYTETGSGSSAPSSTNNSSTISRPRCQCPFGKTGKGCSEDAKINIPRFTKKSWLAFPALRGAYKHVQLRVEIRPESFDGIILLTGERDDLTGDFMALLIHQGFIEFWFDCGSGTGSVRSKETVLLNQWNSVTIYRHRWDAWLVLNHETRVQGRSKGLFSRITFREPVFLGGTGNITGLAKRLPIYEGMVGCIRRFIANEHEYTFDEHPLGDVTKGFDIQDCTTDKCVKYPCQHGGKCLPSEQGAICLCPLGYSGDLCEMRLDLQVPSFNGSSYLRYAPLGDRSLIWLEIEMIIKPQRADGLLLYSGHEKAGDFVALSLNEAFVEFSFDLGSGPAVVRSQYPLSLGHWHSVKISRTARLAVLKVDQLAEVMTISPNGFWHLSLPHSLFLGGIHNVQNLPAGLKEHGSFVGCIQKVDINGRTISIISEALGGTNVDNCPHACVARPCGPLSQCVPVMDNYECRCSPFNVLCNKAEEVPLKQVVNNNSKEQKGEQVSFRAKPKHHKKHGTTSKLSAHRQHHSKIARKHHKHHDRYSYHEQEQDLEQNHSEDVKLSDWKNFPRNKEPSSTEYLADYSGTNKDRNPIDTGSERPKKFNYDRNSLKPRSHVYVHDKYAMLDAEQLSKQNRKSKGHQQKIRKSEQSSLVRDDNNDNDDDNEEEEDVDEKEQQDEAHSDENNEKQDSFFSQVQSNEKHTPHYRTHKKKDQRDDIDSDSNYLFDGEEDYKAKDLIEDMERIMKNGDNIRLNNDEYGSSGYKRTIGACFTGTDSFFHYNDAETMSHVISYKIDLNLRFKTHSKFGVILWSGRQSALENDDFLSLGVENGYLHLRYNLGSGETNIQFNATRVSDGLWHRVRAMRNLQEGSLEVDGRKSVIQRSPGKLRQLNTDTGLYVGGMPNVVYYTRRRYYSGIIGCISEIVLAGEVRLTLNPATLGTAHNVEIGIL